MLRLGPPPSETREMDIDDIFFSRLKLMVIMAKAYLEGYPLGEYRCRAMLENARHLETDAMDMANAAEGFSYSQKPAENDPFDHVFYQRVKLLAVMVKAVAKGFPMGDHRKTAMLENLDIICKTLKFNGKAADMAFLKVA